MTPLATDIARTRSAGRRSRATDPSPARRAPIAQVVVLEDDDARRDLLSDIVERAGAQPTSVGSGAEALDHLRTDHVDCLLVGELPDGSAQAFVEWARPRHPELAILAIAAGVADATELYHAGADLVAMLPLDVDLLGAKLAAAMRRLAPAPQQPLRLAS
jgi:DNA-binding response OmpR family regulator